MIIKDDVLRSGNESKVDPEYQPRTVLLDEVDEDKRHKGSSEELAPNLWEMVRWHLFS